MLCRQPIFLEAANGIVPCGQCLHCRIKKRREKATRALLESKFHEHSLFVTLTYNDQYLPVVCYHPQTDVKYEHPLGVLDITAIQKFNKRLRRASAPHKLRIFYCGEYGELRGRPHFHLVIWGLPYEKKHLIYKSWCDPVTGDLMADPDYIDVQVPKSDWDVSQYCVKYNMKIKTRKQAVFEEGRPKEFAKSSKGLGLKFVDNLVECYKTENVQAFIRETGDIPRVLKVNGKTLPLDRYMREKILKRLGIYEEIKANNFATYQEEMQSLREIAGFDQKAENLKKIIYEGYKANPKREAYKLEAKFVEVNLPEMLVKEKLFDLKKPQPKD